MPFYVYRRIKKSKMAILKQNKAMASSFVWSQINFLTSFKFEITFLYLCSISMHLKILDKPYSFAELKRANLNLRIQENWLAFLVLKYEDST